MAKGQSIKRAHKPEYDALKNAINRCDNPQHAHYRNYGGRGIKVDESFYGVIGFYRFLHEVGLRPGPLYSLDRINNDRGYEPGNLRWATRTEQQRNRREEGREQKDLGHGFGYYETRGKGGCVSFRKSPYIVHDGRKLTLRAWADELGLAITTIRQRLMKAWPLEVVLSSTKFSPHSKELDANLKRARFKSRVGETIDLLDVSINAISKRLH